MAFDFKKEYKKFYLPPQKPQIVTVPKMQFVAGFDYADKSSFNWISVIRLPDFVTQKDFNWAKETATSKKGMDCSHAELFTLEEGECVQIMHVGSYDDEPATVEKMHEFVLSNGYVLDFSNTRLHHEIYLSDPCKTAPEKLKTVIRHPVRKEK